MTNYNERLDEILDDYADEHRNHAYDFDNKEISQTEYFKSMRNDKQTAKQAITSLTKELVAEVIKKPHILPKNAQHLESVKQGINFYHRQMRKRVDRLKEEV